MSDLDIGWIMLSGAGNTLGPANVIANSMVSVLGATSVRNTITRNSIYGSYHKGIKLEEGGNSGLPEPPLPPPMRFRFPASPPSQDGASCVACTIEVFSDPEHDGKQFIGSTATAADGSWTVHLSAPLPYRYVTATTTNTEGNTSEFSAHARGWRSLQFSANREYRR